MKTLLVLVSLCAACGPTIAPTTRAEVIWTVRVRQSATQPIAGASITVTGQRVGVTDAQGEWPVILPYQQPVTVTIAKAGYVTSTDTVTPQLAQSTWTFFLNPLVKIP